jgi:hypothetical protein
MKHAVVVIFSIVVLMFSSLTYAYGQNQQPPGTLRSLLLHELHTTHNKPDWFVPINVAVDGLTAQQASWQPSGGLHSSGQLAYHLLFWNRHMLEQLKTGKEEKYNGTNDETFTKFDDKQWSDIVKQLEQVMTDYEKFVESADDQKLASVATMVGNICTHNAYHVGQIVYARKLQGSWNPEKGVK